MKNGWRVTNLGDLCRITTGKKDVNQGNPNGAYPFFTCAAKHTFSDTYSFDAEALLIAGNGDVGNVSYFKGKFEAYQRTYVVSGFVGVLPRFLYLILDGKLKDTVSKQKLGNTMPYIKMGMLTDFPVPVPPLPEQRRIVGILDEAFAGIATAKRSAEKNLQNARALFESHLNAVFTKRGDGWDEQPLVSLCSLFVDSAHRTPKYQEEGIPALRPRDVVNGKLNLNEAQRVSEEECGIQSKRHKPRPGDIVYSRELSYGWAAILPESPRVCLSQGMCIFCPNGDVKREYLVHVLNSSVGREQAQRAAVGAAHPHINLSDIKAYRIPYPSIDRQKEITTTFDAIAGETQRLEFIYQRKLAALDELKKSLLHQAFRGEL